MVVKRLKQTEKKIVEDQKAEETPFLTMQSEELLDALMPWYGGTSHKNQ